MIEETNLKNNIESLIFVSGKPINFKRLAQITKSDVAKVKENVSILQQEYLDNKKGVRLVTQASSVQMVSAPENGPAVKTFLTYELQENLSAAALETLAIVAYRGPITRARIEVIRGVNCIYILRNLLIRGLIDKRKSEKDARMSIYEVSFEFLRHMGVAKVQNLPEFNELSKETSFEEWIKEQEAKAKAAMKKEEEQKEQTPKDEQQDRSQETTNQNNSQSSEGKAPESTA